MPLAACSEKDVHLPDEIAEFGVAIAHELRFDAQLARRVRAEAEDHLLEALAGRDGPCSVEAQREAIRAFGNAHELARAFVPGALQSLARRASVLTALAVIGVFAAMDARVAWYGWMQWQPGDHLRAANAVALPADHLAFAIAFVLSLAALAYAMTRRAPARLNPAFGRQIRRCMALGAMTLAALFAAIATEAVLTGIRLVESDVEASALVPALSLVTEAALATGCAACVRASLRRLSLALRLVGED
jgi:hypothetical protein